MPPTAKTMTPTAQQDTMLKQLLLALWVRVQGIAPGSPLFERKTYVKTALETSTAAGAEGACPREGLSQEESFGYSYARAEWDAENEWDAAFGGVREVTEEQFGASLKLLASKYCNTAEAVLTFMQELLAVPTGVMCVAWIRGLGKLGTALVEQAITFSLEPLPLAASQGMPSQAPNSTVVVDVPGAPMLPESESESDMGQELEPELEPNSEGESSESRAPSVTSEGRQQRSEEFHRLRALRRRALGVSILAHHTPRHDASSDSKSVKEVSLEHTEPLSRTAYMRETIAAASPRIVSVEALIQRSPLPPARPSSVSLTFVPATHQSQFGTVQSTAQRLTSARCSTRAWKDCSEEHWAASRRASPRTQKELAQTARLPEQWGLRLLPHKNRFARPGELESRCLIKRDRSTIDELTLIEKNKESLSTQYLSGHQDLDDSPQLRTPRPPNEVRGAPSAQEYSSSIWAERTHTAHPDRVPQKGAFLSCKIDLKKSAGSATPRPRPPAQSRARSNPAKAKAPKATHSQQAMSVFEGLTPREHIPVPDPEPEPVHTVPKRQLFQPKQHGRVKQCCQAVHVAQGSGNPAVGKYRRGPVQVNIDAHLRRLMTIGPEQYLKDARGVLENMQKP